MTGGAFARLYHGQPQKRSKIAHRNHAGTCRFDPTSPRAMPERRWLAGLVQFFVLSGTPRVQSRAFINEVHTPAAALDEATEEKCLPHFAPTARGEKKQSRAWEHGEQLV